MPFVQALEARGSQTRIRCAPVFHGGDPSKQPIGVVELANRLNGFSAFDERLANVPEHRDLIISREYLHTNTDFKNCARCKFLRIFRVAFASKLDVSLNPQEWVSTQAAVLRTVLWLYYTTRQSAGLVPIRRVGFRGQSGAEAPDAPASGGARQLPEDHQGPAATAHVTGSARARSFYLD